MPDVVKIELTSHEKFAIYIAGLYANDMEFIIGKIISSMPLRVCLWDCYKEMKIDSIPDDAVAEVLARSFEWQPIDITEQNRVGICKCIYLLNHVFERWR